MKTKGLQSGVLIVLMGLLVFAVLQRQAVADWFRLRGYTASAHVSQLAADDAMTDQARHLLYVNKPEITSGTSFTSKCPPGGEKTIVLGCYIGNDGGIYVYRVDDERLHGVEQVTTAHEMLHAAYRRLSKSDRKWVDGMLTDYYNRSLSDERVRDIIDSYKQTEPDDVVNEMHSIFGTELTDLPAPLETYYKRYFTDRAKVTGYAVRYQAEFTSRRERIEQYDAQLKDLKPRIESNQSTLSRQKATLDAQAHRMDTLKAGGQNAAYNNEVPSYNRAVDAYNTLRNATKNMIDQYNTIVDTRNAIALEEHELTQELSANALPS